MDKKVLIGPFSQVVPMTKLPLKGALPDEQLMLIEDGGILIMNNKIAEVGSFESLKPKADTIEYIEGAAVCLPGFIDAHTHIC
ncbi:MAG: imidazolonepropionase, partial [Croceitalea sp.]|nr:imidazolonepropionase [Croceitalea sp.]